MSQNSRNLHANVNFTVQGQKSRSNTPTFTRLTEPTNIHYEAKMDQNQTSSFQVI